MKDYSWLKEHCYRVLKLPTSPKTTEKHLMILELIGYYEEHEAMLNKIRSEIEQAYCIVANDYDNGRNYGLYMATQIIDKYKAESEG